MDLEEVYYTKFRPRLTTAQLGKYVLVFTLDIDKGYSSRYFDTEAAALHFAQLNDLSPYFVTCYGGEDKEIVTPFQKAAGEEYVYMTNKYTEDSPLEL